MAHTTAQTTAEKLTPTATEWVQAELDSCLAEQLSALGIHPATTVLGEQECAQALLLAARARGLWTDLDALAGIGAIVHWHVCDARERDLPTEVIEYPWYSLTVHVDPLTCSQPQV